MVKTTLIRDLTFFKLTHHEVKEARRRRKKKKNNNNNINCIWNVETCYI